MFVTGQANGGGASGGLMGTTMMTPVERQMGRFMRAPDGHDGGMGGGAEGGMAPGGNNGGENSGGQGGGNSGENNSGQEFNPASFWDDPQEESQPNGDKSGDQGSGNQGGGDEASTLGKAISDSVAGFTSPVVMDAEVVEGISNGDFTKFNENLNASMQKSMESSIKTNVQILKAFGEHLMGQVRDMVDGSLRQKDDSSFLHDKIPASKNPAVAPMIKSVYDRALTLTKGNRDKAVVMTKNMLKAMASESAADLDLRVAPIGADSDMPSGGSKTNWLEALNEPR